MGENKSCMLGGVKLGEGMPKIIVPVMGKTIEEIVRGAAAAYDAGADIIELRIDSFSDRPSEEQVIKACMGVKEVVPELPLLLTFRTAREGGKGVKEGYFYIMLLLAICQAHACDAIDVELSMGEQVMKTLVSAAHAQGMAVIGSAHEFGELSDRSKIAQEYNNAQAWGADVAKTAVMAHSAEEAMELGLAMRRAGQALDIPYIGIAMGKEGAFLRACCEAVGCCASFAMGLEASAPGQLDAGKLRAAMEILHG